jgi:hypothetical protein
MFLNRWFYRKLPRNKRPLEARVTLCYRPLNADINPLDECSAELERSTLGVDSEHRPPVINILFGTHKYSDEKAGTAARSKARLNGSRRRTSSASCMRGSSDDERRSWDCWKNPPKKLN